MRKKTAVITITFLSAAVIALGVFAWNSASRAKHLEYYARANTQHAFDELVTSMNELSTSMQKSIYVSDPALEAALCAQVFGRALTAQMSLSVLPYASQELEQTSNFVSKVGDYAYVLARSVGQNGGYSEQELKNLTNLSETAGVLAQNLSDMQRQIMDGSLTMAEVYKQQAVQSSENTDNEVPAAGTAFQNIESEFPEMPSLLYDGPFSEGLTTGKLKFLADKDEINAEQARKAVAKFLSVAEKDVAESSECEGEVPCWICTAKMNGGEYTVSVTKQGGVILSVLCSRLPGEANYSVQDGLSMARDILKNCGLDSMRESYHMVQGNILTVNFAYEQDGILCYPDLVKVGIALDNGTLMSYDAQGYIDSHVKRNIPAPSYSEDDAIAQATRSLTVDSVSLAIIPSDGGEERLCYEIVCSGKGETKCILYVNAQTGAEEKILLLLEDENGTLAI